MTEFEFTKESVVSVEAKLFYTFFIGLVFY